MSEERHFRVTNSIGAATQKGILNLPRLMSSANRKEYHNIDMKGNAQLYTIAVNLSAPANTCSLKVEHAPNTYVTMRAVKAWHKARVKMFKRLGISLKDLGTYGRTLRPYLNSNHQQGNSSGTELTTQTSGSNGWVTPVTSGEWTYSSAATTVPIEEGEYSSQTFYPSDLVDTYNFHLLGAHRTEETGTVSSADPSSAIVADESYHSVGMIRGWLDSFAQKTQPDTGESDFVDPDNPLLQLMADSISSEEASEIAEDVQKEKSPWDRGGTMYDDFSSQKININGRTDRTLIVDVPCGLMKLEWASTNDPAVEVQTDIEVLGIRDM